MKQEEVDELYKQIWEERERHIATYLEELKKDGITSQRAMDAWNKVVDGLRNLQNLENLGANKPEPHFNRAKEAIATEYWS